MFWMVFVVSIIASSSSFAQAPASTTDEISCACEDLSCKPCEIETNLTFYTSKCGPNGSKVKSCKRPTCNPVENTSQCIADLERNSKQKENVAKEDAKTEAPVVAAIPIGAITNSSGQAKIVRAGGAREVAKMNVEVYEGDSIQTEGDGKVRVQLKDKNVLNVASNSNVIIEQQLNDIASGKHKTMLNLMYGKLRAQVNKDNKYDGKDNTFNVKTKAAVAGVRGTDFITSFNPGDKAWTSEVYTFEGRVEFGGDSQEQKVAVTGGQTASFTIDTPAGDEVTDMQLRDYIRKGMLSNVRQMNDTEKNQLDVATDFKSAQATKSAQPIEVAKASDPDSICTEPRGDYKSCSFTCEGNPASESKCRTDMKAVACVRRICNAAGKWASPMAMPKRYGTLCESGHAVVRRDCTQE
jgi:hypothetical protein